MTLMIQYDYVSWERLFPGYGIDLTALRFEPADDCRAGAAAALKHLRLGRRPKPGRSAETAKPCNSSKPPPPTGPSPEGLPAAGEIDHNG